MIKHIAMAVAASLALIVTLTPTPVDGQSDDQRGDAAVSQITRVAGVSRATTAVELSRTSHLEGTTTVVLARDDAYPDALAGGPLAALVEGPLLLTSSDALSADTAAEIDRLGAREVILLGGPSALSSSIEADLAELGITNVRRLAGNTRFETAAVIAAEFNEVEEIYLTRGADDGDRAGWPDAVAVGALAARQQQPILLAGGQGELPTETAAAIGEVEADTVILVGGTGALPEGLQAEVGTLGVETGRIAGASRTETAARVAARAVADGADATQPWLATAADFPDALAAGPAVAASGGVLLLSDADDLAGSPAVAEWLERHRGNMTTVRLVGGPAVLSDALATQVEELVFADRTTPQHIRAAYEAGDLSVDDAARYSLFSTLDPSRVPLELQGAAVEGEFDGSLDIVAWWEDLQPDTQEELGQYLAVREAPEQEQARRLQDWTDCSGLNYIIADIPLPCVAEVDVDSDGDVDFQVFYSVGRGGVAPIDDDVSTEGDDVTRPDLIDLVIDSVTHAWTVYVAAGFEAPEQTDIIMFAGMLPGAGLALPDLFEPGVRNIYLDTDETRVSEYLPRHELFHQFQYSYIGAAEYSAHRDGMTWWLEATANWAAGIANADQSATQEVPGHAGQLSETLGQPERRFDEARALTGGNEYGSFIVAEFLAQRENGAQTIESTLQRSGEGPLGRNPTDVVADLMGRTEGFAAEMMRYRQWSYVLNRDRTIGFDTDDVSLYWRPELNNDPRTRGGEVSTARPQRSVVEFNPRSIADGFAILDPTGATYVDLVIPPGQPVEITLTSDNEDVSASVLSFGRYPNQCDDPTPIPRSSSVWSARIDPSPTCSRLTLIISNGSRNQSASVVWEAVLPAEEPDPSPSPSPIPPQPPTPDPPAAPSTQIILSGRGLSEQIQFGDDAETVLRAMTDMLGPPINDTGWQANECPVPDGLGDTRTVVFNGILVLDFRREPTPTFESWTNGFVRPLYMTERGITLGSTNTEVDNAYPEATFDTSDPLMPIWQIPETAGGPMRAFALDSDPDSSIVQLSSGADYRCP